MADRAGARILVVDDNPATRYSTSRVLRSAGFDVIEASTGQQAVELASGLPDLVVLDVNLPDMDGFEVCRTLRNAPATSRIPVVHLSATFVKDADKVQGFEAGADGYITHPVEPLVLIATVNAFLRTRHAEEAMRTSEAKFKAVFEQALNGIALLDEGMIYLDVNPALCQTVGRSRDDIVGKHLSAFLPHDAESQLLSMTTVLSGTGSWRGVFPLLHTDGRAVQLEWSVSFHSMPGARLAVTTDISERMAIEADRERLLVSERAARAEAERANRVKDDFLAALSHELRTPLNAILGWAQLLKRQMASATGETVRGIDAIERNARVQTQLIADLLDVSRITSGKLVLDPRWFDPAITVEVAVGALVPAAQARGVAIQMELDPQAGDIWWDEARFQQVIWNLVDNAVKFSKTGATVTLRLSRTADGIELRVEDQGRGISPEFLPYIFDRFRQEDSGTTRGHSGLGLGLAIVKQLVDAHGGSIEAMSEGERRGSTFVVRLPRGSTSEGVSATRGAGPQLAGVRVLVVDDDADALTLVSRILADAEATVFEAASVAEALAALDTFHPRLLVSDIGMPGRDGYELIGEIRRRDIGPDRLPAIALTAFGRVEDRDRILEAGYQRYMGKPVDALKLLDMAAALARTDPKETT